MTLTVGSLFSGIGGLDLGLERAGMTVKWQSETDPYCSKVLKKHWPDVPNLGDVTKVDWSEVERVELICGGFPCQPFSLAGRRAGKDDDRYLWPEVVRAVRVLRPRYVLLENVPGLLARGMGDVLGDLAACGYDAEWDCIPAAYVGAPHLRYRVFIVADRGGARRRQDPRSPHADEGEHAGWAAQDDHVVERDGESGRAGHVADPHSERRAERRLPEGQGRPGVSDATGCGRGGSDPCTQGGRGADVADPERVGRYGRAEREPGDAQGEGEHVHASGCGGSGIGDYWAVEPDIRRVAHGVPSRVDRLRALGNAVVPQVAEYVGRLLMAELERRARVDG